jgi:hypothetical protein
MPVGIIFRKNPAVPQLTGLNAARLKRLLRIREKLKKVKAPPF